MAPFSASQNSSSQRWIRPPPLRPGDRVRLIAPGGAFAPEALTQGLACLKAQNLEPVGHGQLGKQMGYYAGTDIQRAQVLADALADDEAQAVWAIRGGSGSARVVAHVPALAPHALRAQPKWLVGFSDITCLHGVWAQAQVMSLHGANLVNLPDWGASAQANLFATLFGQEAVLPVWPGTVLATGLTRRVTGPVVGGNLTVLASLCGTGYMPSWAGCIVVLEDIDEAPYRLDRCLHQLVLAGAFDGALGVVFGQWTRCDAGRVLPMLAATLAPLGLPLLADVPLGHDASSWAIVFGAQAALDVDAQTFGPI